MTTDSAFRTLTMSGTSVLQPQRQQRPAIPMLEGKLRVTTVEANAPDCGSLARLVLKYADLVEEITAKGGQPGFSDADWAPLAELVAVDRFERAGPFLEILDWHTYIGYLTQWARSETRYETTLYRMTETPGRVYMELEERFGIGAGMHAINSVTVYDFDENQKLCYLNVYIQKSPDSP